MLALILAVSLASNAALLFALARRPLPQAQARLPVEPAARDTPPANGPETSPNEPTAHDPCAERLAACERRSWDLVVSAITMPPAQPDPSHDRADAGAPRTGASEQAAALCTAAERSLREQWQRERPTMIANLSRSFGDPAEQDRNVEHEVTSMSEVARLSDAQRAELASAYRTRRLARIDEARVALQRDPPDLGALPTIGRGLFSDEDVLLERIAGAGARDAWRARQLEGRSVILAIVATLADRDWDTALGW